MEVPMFESLLERLTGTGVKELTDADRASLAEALTDDTRAIDATQFNELMLLANKDRVEKAFFHFFFVVDKGQTCSVGNLLRGVERFQLFALLRFGNFIYAFRMLSKCKSKRELRKLIGGPARNPERLEAAILDRPHKILRVTAIPRERTYLVGYLSTREITADREGARWLADNCDANDASGAALLEAIARAPITQNQRELMVQSVSRIAALFAAGKGPSVPDALKLASGQLEELWNALTSVQATGKMNTDVYLTWDHMDIYFATSMRKPWEYEDLHGFVDTLMRNESLAPLRLRYFDPTQSYDANRINKGLVEALMLKRAAVTVYSIQDTDTLGKDSELAATLAQGKPVIAYAPRIDARVRAGELYQQKPQHLRDRLIFALHTDEICRGQIRSDVVTQFLDSVAEYEATAPWRCLPDEQAKRGFQTRNDSALKAACAFLAAGESRIAETRARTLQSSHPLGIQVNLATGVANGVLVVRTIPDCAEVIRRIVTNRMEFVVEDDQKLKAWVLREKISECVYRVVTRDRKLTNCFWNFYRRSPFLDHTNEPQRH